MRYKPKPYAGRVTLFRSPGHPFLCSFDPRYGWGELAMDGVDMHVVSGHHESILEEPYVKEVGAEMSRVLRRAQTLQEAPRIQPPPSSPAPRVEPVSASLHANSVPAPFAIAQRALVEPEAEETRVNLVPEEKESDAATSNGQPKENFPAPELPTDRPLTNRRSWRSRVETLALPGPLLEALKRFSRREAITLFLTIMAASGTLLYRHTRQDSFAVSATMSGRARNEIRNLIGLLSNVWLVRTDFSGNPTFKEVAQRCRESFGKSGQGFVESGLRVLVALDTKAEPVPSDAGRRVPLSGLLQVTTVFALATLLSTGRRREGTGARRIVPCSRNDGAPLSFAQQRIWFLHQLDPNSPAYNLAHQINIKGSLDVEVLEAALRAIVSRHEALRTHFVERGGETRQHVGTADGFKLHVVDLMRGLAPSRDELQRIAAEEATKPFDLGARFHASCAAAAAGRLRAHAPHHVPPHRNRRLVDRASLGRTV
jgi:hypothetical protein